MENGFQFRKTIYQDEEGESKEMKRDWRANEIERKRQEGGRAREREKDTQGESECVEGKMEAKPVG